MEVLSAGGGPYGAGLDKRSPQDRNAIEMLELAMSGESLDYFRHGGESQTPQPGGLHAPSGCPLRPLPMPAAPPAKAPEEGRLETRARRPGHTASDPRAMSSSILRTLGGGGAGTRGCSLWCAPGKPAAPLGLTACFLPTLEPGPGLLT